MTRKARATSLGIVTDSGSFVRKDVLDTYAVKQESRQIHGDEFPKLGDDILKPRYNPSKLAAVLDLNTYHTRCCETKARDTAGLGWVLTPRSRTRGSEEGADAEAEPDPAEKQRITDFFTDLPIPDRSVDHEISIIDILYEAQFDYEGIGRGAIEVVREDHDPNGRPVQLAHIPAHTIHVHKDRKRFVQKRGIRKVWFKRIGLDADVNAKTGEMVERGSLDPNQRATEIIYWRNYSPNDETYGVPDFIPALGAIHGDIARRDFNIAFFDNWGVPAYAVYITGNFDPGDTDKDGKTEIERRVEEHFTKLRDRPHSTLVMTLPTPEGSEEGEVKVEFEPLGVDVKEASFRLYRQDNREEVLVSHGVPGGRVGVGEPGTAGREATEVYKRSVIEPRQRRLEGLVNRYILRDAFGIRDWDFELFEVDNKDEAHEMDLLLKLHSIRAVTAREVRRIFADRFGLDPEAEIPDEELPDLNEVEAALNSTQERLLDLVRRDLANADGNGDGDGHRDRDLRRALAGV